ncbi:hypothetical protein [Burkholderia sp. PAMC 28687]|nr:hypothetical protein [Burkholderia sp. PAMC 28687]
MSNAWIYPFIILGGVLQAAGAPIKLVQHRFCKFVAAGVARL